MDSAQLDISHCDTSSNPPHLKENLIELLFSLTSPECLENSKVIPLLADSSLSFKVTDLLQLKELSDLFSSKTELVYHLMQLGFLKLSDDIAYYDIPPNLSVICFHNFPHQMTKEDFCKALDIPRESYLRCYHKGNSLMLVPIDQENVVSLQEKLKDFKVNGSIVHYEVINQPQMLMGIYNQIQANSYHKEANDLQAENIRRQSSTTSDSWRKRSGECPSFDLTEKSHHYLKQNTKPKESFYKKRERFNSEGFSNSKPMKAIPYSALNSTQRNFEEIEIDISNLKYSLTIKQKYTLQDILQFHQKLKHFQAYDAPPQYNTPMILPEIMAVQPKDIVIFSKQDQLAENNTRKSSLCGEKYENHRVSESRIANGNNSIKLPKMNPLGSIPKTFNKFDAAPGNTIN